MQFQLEIICCFVRNFKTSEHLLNPCEIVSSTLAVFYHKPQVKIEGLDGGFIRFQKKFNVYALVLSSMKAAIFHWTLRKL